MQEGRLVKMVRLYTPPAECICIYKKSGVEPVIIGVELKVGELIQLILKVPPHMETFLQLLLELILPIIILVPIGMSN